jgi:hypothetical protein
MASDPLTDVLVLHLAAAERVRDLLARRNVKLLIERGRDDAGQVDARAITADLARVNYEVRGAVQRQSVPVELDLVETLLGVSDRALLVLEVLCQSLPADDSTRGRLATAAEALGSTAGATRGALAVERGEAEPAGDPAGWDLGEGQS